MFRMRNAIFWNARFDTALEEAEPMKDVSIRSAVSVKVDTECSIRRLKISASLTK